MGATLEHFLRTGQLGPIALGMDPAEVEARLGEPQARSHKLNPLVLKYGGLELTFWSEAKRLPSQLMQIALSVQPGTEPLPAPVIPDDWSPTSATTIDEFADFLTSIDASPVQTVSGDRFTHIIMPSGVRISFSEGRLIGFQFSRRESEENRTLPLTDEREPSVLQVCAVLDEARRVTELGFLSAGLILAWAALEASLRRAALSAGLKGKIGIQPSALIRQLLAARLLNPPETAFLEKTRQLRTAIVHGLSPQPIGSDTITKIIDLAKRLIELSSSPESKSAKER